MRAITLGLGLIVLLGIGAPAQTLSTNNTRSLSLEECIRSALEKNLDLQIARIEINIARNRLFGAYGYYDPRIDLTADYSLETSEETIDFRSGTIVAPGQRSAHAVSAGFVGALPWGMQYDIGADLAYIRRTGTERFRTNIVVAPGVTNIIDEARAFDLDSYNVDTGIAITQPLLRNFWIDQGRMTIRFNRAGLKISEFALLDRINTVVRDVMLNYYELIFTVENVRVSEKALELAQRQATENRKRVEVGTMAPLEEKQAEAAAATARAALISALQRAGTQQRRLIALITDNYEQWQEVQLVPTESLLALPQAYNMTGSWVEALTRRPDFNRIKEQVEQQGIEVSFRQNQLYPQLDLVGTYGRRGVDRRIGGALYDVREENLPRYSFGIVFSIPLENKSSRAALRESRLVRDRLTKQLEQLHQQILVDVQIAVGAAQAEFQRAAATREASLAAEAAYEAEVKKLENGKSTSFNVLSLQNDLTTARSDHIRALADYNRALAELYFQEGTILEKRRIAVQPQP